MGGGSRGDTKKTKKLQKTTRKKTKTGLKVGFCGSKGKTSNGQRKTAKRKKRQKGNPHCGGDVSGATKNRNPGGHCPHKTQKECCCKKNKTKGQTTQTGRVWEENNPPV